MDDAEKESADQLPSPRDPYTALRYPSYRRYIGGVFLGRLGRSMVDLAVSWQVYEWTESAAALGLVGVVHILPLLFFGLPAGNWADRHNRKQITVYTSIGTATLSATLGILALWRDRIPNVLPLSLLGDTINGIIAFLERAPASLPATGTNGALPLLYLIILVLAAVKIVSGPSRAAMLPNLGPAHGSAQRTGLEPHHLSNCEACRARTERIPYRRGRIHHSLLHRCGFHLRDGVYHQARDLPGPEACTTNRELHSRSHGGVGCPQAQIDPGHHYTGCYGRFAGWNNCPAPRVRGQDLAHWARWFRLVNRR